MRLLVSLIREQLKRKFIAPLHIDLEIAKFDCFDSMQVKNKLKMNHIIIYKKTLSKWQIKQPVPFFQNRCFFKTIIP